MKYILIKVKIKNGIVDEGNAQKAADAFEKAANGYPNKFNVYYNLGISYENLKKWNNALNAFKKAEEIDSEDSDLLANMGLCYKEIDDNENAISYSERAIEQDNNNILAYITLINAYFKMGGKSNYLKAQKYISILETLDYNDKAQLYTKIGDIYFKIEDYPNAAKNYDKATKIGANMFITWRNYSSSLLRGLKKYKEAYRTINKALNLKNDDPASLEIKGEIEIELKKYDDAKRTFKKLLQVAPNYSKAGKIKKYLEKLK